ncbi:restriction endonuclease subunit S [Cloacibacterium sp.]|uniref:restriction endonuclease subunit S n=1 Tax=Cloacibacterium sp. TaxID=1913682 RepID=UPI0035AF873F
MKEENKSVKNFPNLRFPEFKGEWELINLGNCAYSFEYGMNASAIKFDGKNRYIRITDIDESSSKYRPEFPVSPNGQLLDKYLVSENDILFARTGASTGKSYLYHKDDGKLYFAGFLIRAKIKEEFNSYFVFTQTKTIQYYKWVQLMSMRSGQPGINSQEYASYSFNIPSKNEQDKIVSFLTFIDSRISTQKKIIEKLETLMKGNLEKIFCQKLRFKNKQGNYFYDWRTTILNEICDIKKGEQLNKDDLTETGNYPCLNGGMGFSGYTDKFNSDENTITISEGGNSCGFVSFMKSKFWLGGHCYKIILKKDISSIFLFHLLKFYERKIMNLRVGSGLPNIQQKDLRNLQLLVSDNIEEQTKIANYLSSIQEKIETEKKVLEKLELQKKFLLANLFV